MGTIKAVIDSDVLIDFLQGVDAAATEIDRYEDACSSISSWMEVMIRDETDQERFAAETLLESMRRIELSLEVARRAIDLRQQPRVDAIRPQQSPDLGRIPVRACRAA